MKITNEYFDVVNPLYFNFFGIEDDGIVLNTLKELDIESIVEKLKGITLCNYFKYSKIENREQGNAKWTDVFFYAKYDDSKISIRWYQEQGSSNVSFCWSTCDINIEDDKLNEILKGLMEEVIPELIEKILNL